jgi:ankyrin repeat protein
VFVRQRDGYIGGANLIRILKKGHVKIAKLLLEKGAYTRAADNDGWTPLHRPSQNGHAEVAKLLCRNIIRSKPPVTILDIY